MRTRNLTICLIALTLCLAHSQVMGALYINDGQTHDIGWQILEDVWVDFQAPGMQTTVNLLYGGDVRYNLGGFEDSRINLIGGRVRGALYSYGCSQVNISSDGRIDSSLEATDYSQVNISGGWIGQLNVTGWSQVNISGGRIGGWMVAHSGEIDMSGGTVGGAFYLGSSVLTIYGRDFAIDGSPVGYGDITTILGGRMWDEPYRNLTGTLVSGEAIANNFYIGNGAKITLVPEPATLLLLGFGAVMLRRKGLRCRRISCFSFS